MGNLKFPTNWEVSWSFFNGRLLPRAQKRGWRIESQKTSQRMSPVWLECWLLISSRFCSVFCFSRPRIDFSSWELAVPLVQRTCCTSLRLSRPLTSLSPKCFECRSNVREEVCHPGAGVVQHKDPTLAAHCWILVNKVVRSQGRCRSLVHVAPRGDVRVDLHRLLIELKPR